MPVNTRSAVPAGGFPFITHPYRQHILSAGLVKPGGKVIIKRRVAIRMVAQVMTVEPHIRVHIHAVEIDADELILPGGGCNKVFAVPARTTHGKSRGPTSDGVFIERSDDLARFLVWQILNAPIVRQVNFSPGLVVVIYLLRTGDAVPDKPPILIKRDIS